MTFVFVVVVKNTKNAVLYEEITMLQKWCKCRWVVENVQPYYKPLLNPNFILDRHLIWCNFHIPHMDFMTNWVTGKVKGEKELLQKKFGFDLSKYKGFKRKSLRNCVIPEMGLHILNSAEKDINLCMKSY